MSLEIIPVMQGAIYAYVREHGSEPAHLLIGTSDVPRLLHEMNKWRLHVDAKKPKMQTFEGIPVAKINHVSGCLATGVQLYKLLEETGQVSPL